MKQPDNSKKRKKNLALYFAVLIVLVVADFFVHKHAEISLEGLPLFYVIFGILSGAAMVILAFIIRFLFTRDERYYE